MISIDGIIKNNKKENKIKRAIKSLLIGRAKIIFSTNKRTDEIIKNIAPKADIYRHIFSTLKRNDIEKNAVNCLDILSKYKINIEKKKILFVGKFLISKGIKEFVECSNTMNYEFIMVGGSISELKQLGLEIGENIKVIPFLEKEDILKLMSVSDVFVLPTYTDVWGLVIIEALMCNVPVITTDQCNAGVEFVKDYKNGFIIQINDVKSIQNAIYKSIELNRDFVKKYNINIMGDYTIENAAYRMQKVIYEKG